MLQKLKLSGGILVLCLFIITIAITITIFMVPLFQLNIHIFNLDEVVGLSAEAIMENYHILLQYLNIPWINELSLPDFPVSTSGAFHFYEVKQLFIVNYIILVISGVVTYFFLNNLRKKKQMWRLIQPFQYLIWLPAVVIILLMANFDRIFVLFHELLFNNDDWLFNPVTDPIILVLPEQFFFQCFVLAFVIIQVSLWNILRRAKKSL